MTPTDPHDLAALAACPAFAQFVAALRGGEGPCGGCAATGWVPPDGGFGATQCRGCSGSGRVAVPPDLEAAHMAADWWQEQGGDLPGMLWVYAVGTPPADPPAPPPGWVHAASVERPWLDDSLRPALAALTERDPDPRVRALAAARGLGMVESGGRGGAWCVGYFGEGGEGCILEDDHHPATEPAARRALKRAVLALYDPLVRVPYRAEGARLTVRHGPGPEFEIAWRAWKQYQPLTQGDDADDYRLDGVRLGAPPDWSWTPHRLPCGACYRGYVGGVEATARCQRCGGSGVRLAVTWECRPSDLLPAAAPDATRPRCTECGGPGYVVRDRYRTTCRACDGTGFEDEAARQREAEREWRGEEPLY